jgi:hypothetical protein
MNRSCAIVCGLLLLALGGSAAGGIDVVPPKPACSEADFGAGGVGPCGGLGILRPAHRSRSQG